MITIAMEIGNWKFISNIKVAIAWIYSKFDVFCCFYINICITKRTNFS